ncbi:MAG: DUF6179 domain-containing protein [Clostridiales bacterium]|nr:DUF6179 domain-containing protein [Clostridiales bacterium]MDO4349554.1 DUF6179 domain-containing protein [Eubacteriales bacterium]MDY4007265.1 DUF6179 domain-containing protein [Candidatus Limiplasma sp.]
MRPDAWLAQLDLTHGERTLLANRLWALLERTVRRYTQGDSTSVPQETAEELLTSLCFTLERYRSLNGIPVRGLLDGAMEQWLERAQERLCADVEDGKRLWTRACASLPPFESEAMQGTLRAIGGFFDRYDAAFLAHEIPCMIDYPLMLPVSEALAGIDFIRAYLWRIVVENALLAAFDPREERRVNSLCCAEYATLPVNLCLPVLTNAVGRGMAGLAPGKLLLARKEFATLEERLAGLGRGALLEALEAAAERVCAYAGLTDAQARGYAGLAARTLAPRILAARPDRRHVFLIGP